MPALFASEVAILIDRILQNPKNYPQFKKGYHQALMKTFPYFIIYTLDENAAIITIVSIFHTSRHPRKKL